MASSYTANYGLCQWAPENAFLREEFNQDNAKIDAALKETEERAAERAQAAEAKADRALSGLQDQSYNIYNLILQNDYEGKYTGYKKALFFDGFTDESNVAEKSSGIVISNGAAWLYRNGQSSLSLGSYGTETSLNASSAEVTAQRTGRLTGFTCKIKNGMSIEHGPSIEAVLYRNGQQVLAQEFTASVISPNTSQTQSFTFRESFPFATGDRFQLSLRIYISYLYLTTDGDLAGTLNAQAISGTAGTITSAVTSMPLCQGAQAWVRHKGGTVGLSLKCGGETVPLTAGDRRDTVDLLTGNTCTEQAYRLERDLPAGNWQVVLDMTLGSGEEGIQLHDYGIAVL